MELKYGDIVKWTYTHHLNRWSSVRRTRKGIYLGCVKHTRKYWDKPNSRQLCFVKFTGNKKASKLPLHELEGAK